MKTIPKVIHYCWFGGGMLPDSARECIDSWKKFCPDYEIVEWNEKTFDLDSFPYTREAYDAKKFAFVTDVVRLYALVNHGGIYMDTDVEVLKNLDPLLKYEAVSGFESDFSIPTGLMASIPHQKMMELLLDEYNDAHFLSEDGKLDLTTNVVRITRRMSAHGLVPNNELQTIEGFTFLPRDYLCPKDHATGRLNVTENTLTIHHFAGSWGTEEDKTAKQFAVRMPDFLPRKVTTALARLIAVIKHRGLGGALAYSAKRLLHGER